MKTGQQGFRGTDASMTSVHSMADLAFFRGRVALYAILKSLGIGEGHEVATQAFTCVAVPEAIMATGAKPLYVDIEPQSFNMDASSLMNRITERTRAIIVQHTFGIPADMDRIMRIADQAGLPVLEDCCHTLASSYKGKMVGAFGVAGFYSFEWGKPLVAGIGGSALINDPELHDRLEKQYLDYREADLVTQIRIYIQYLAFKLLFKPSLYWQVRSLYRALSSVGVITGSYNPMKNGRAKDFSLKMPPQQRRILIEKIYDMSAYEDHSKWVVSQYRALIYSNLVRHPSLPHDSEVVFARYPLVAKNKATLLKRARSANVELADWYDSPIHPLSQDDWRMVYYKAGSCPNAERLSKQVVSLPTHLRTNKKFIENTSKFFNGLSDE
jgi:perosamine synthetase